MIHMKNALRRMTDSCSWRLSTRSDRGHGKSDVGLTIDNNNAKV
jgi:hypothetical protein